MLAESPSADDLCDRARPRVRIHRDPLPGNSAEDEPGSQRLAQAAEGQGADDVTATACAQHEGAPGGADGFVEGPAQGRGRLGRDGLGGAADVADLRRRAVELGVGHHRGALEGEVPVDLHPRAAAVVLVANAHGHRAGDPMDP